jgi:antitoxin (DNA-binding transcriptional repressor) of toxin-antitoxin stability system
MVVTATQFKSNIGYYLDTVPENDVYITKNGKTVARLCDPMKDKMSILNSLVGILPKDHISLEEAKLERILKRAKITHEEWENMGQNENTIRH